ncbi:hypothetical protein JWG44_13750 [Leptospira sp. 201903071]|uniref:hypothetical protein n=1 Tax=Leptospira ainazelensis TaxID=2810034 RepID=UPI0019626A16|nr:hypothetical protein [Leptospira ainazelensis]MBM9501316.1 hypothetical protein [Leptospira ainazelensis]
MYKNWIYLFCILIFFSLSAEEFKNGVHLINRDKVSHEIVYTESMIPSSKICFVKKSTKAVKNGIAPVSLREGIVGFRILSKKNETQTFQTVTKAVVEAGANVPCLSLSLESFSLGKEISNSKIKDQTIVIESGKILFSQK